MTTERDYNSKPVYPVPDFTFTVYCKTSIAGFIAGTRYTENGSIVFFSDLTKQNAWVHMKCDSYNSFSHCFFHYVHKKEVL